MRLAILIVLAMLATLAVTGCSTATRVKEGFFPELVTPKGHGTPVKQLRSEMAAARYANVASHDFLPLQSFEIFAPNAE